MIKFPLHFEVFAEAQPGISTIWKAQANTHTQIDCCIPVEFSGPGGGYSSEDFFALAIINCIIGAFKFFCEKNNQSFKTIKGKAGLKVESATNKIMKFTAIDIVFDIEGASNIEKVKKLLDEAISNCPVCNSIQIPKTLHISIK